LLAGLFGEIKMKLKDIKRIQFEFMDAFDLDKIEEDLIDKFVMALEKANNNRKCGTGGKPEDFVSIDLILED
jgi:hypothetical protein